MSDEIKKLNSVCVSESIEPPNPVELSTHLSMSNIDCTSLHTLPYMDCSFGVMGEGVLGLLFIALIMKLFEDDKKGK